MEDKIWVRYIGKREGAFGVVGNYTGFSYTISGLGCEFLVQKTDARRFRGLGQGKDFEVDIIPKIYENPKSEEVIKVEENTVEIKQIDNKNGVLSDIDVTNGISEKEAKWLRYYLKQYWEDNDISNLRSLDEDLAAYLRVRGGLKIVKDIIDVGKKGLELLVPEEKADLILREALEFQEKMNR